MTSVERYDYAFDPEGGDWPARLLRRVPEGARVLELGPGAGAMTQVLLGRGHPVTVVENDPAALSRLRAMGVQAVEADLDGVAWREALDGQRFDAVLACDVLEHLRAPDQALKALAGLMQPGGCLIVSVPNIAYAGILAGLRSGVFEYADKGLLDRTHVHFFTRRSIDEMLMDNGWAPLAWEAHRVPLEKSEFAHHGANLSGAWREHLLMGWPDFDVYQWMVVASPVADARPWEGKLLRDEVRGLRDELHALQDRHAQEHGSLIEHQKAFAQAKELIAGFERELADARERELALQAQLRAAQPDVVSWRARLRRLFR